MDEHDEELHGMTGAGAPHAAAGASTVLSGAASKNGLQLLYNLLAIAYHVLEETKHVNLKPPLQPSSRLFTIDAPAPSSPRSPGPSDSPDDAQDNGAVVGSPALHAAAAGHPIVIPYSPEEIQDSYTKLATLKNQYIKMSNDLLKVVKQVEDEDAESSRAADQVGQAVFVLATGGRELVADCGWSQDSIAKLVERRNQLRKVGKSLNRLPVPVYCWWVH